MSVLARLATRTLRGAGKLRGGAAQGGAQRRGLASGAKEESGGWEAIYFTGTFGFSAAFAVAWWFRPETGIEDWALDEVLVREQLVEAGEELETGRNYSQERFGNMWTKEAGMRPVRLGNDK